MRVVPIAKIIPEVIQNHENYDVMYGANTLFDSHDLIDHLETMYYDMSFISHKASVYDYQTFYQIWQMYVRENVDIWKKIFDDISIEISPQNDYNINRTTTPNITVESETTYGKTITSGNTTSNTMTYGKVSTDQTNTFDGTLRDAAKSTNSGTDINSGSYTGSDVSSGTDNNTTSTTGTSTEIESGYRKSPYENLAKNIRFLQTHNLHEKIISDFVRRYLIYDNGNTIYDN